MSVLFLKRNRTRYRLLLERDLENAKCLINEAEQEQLETNIFNKNVRNCVRRLNEFIEKLEQAIEQLSLGVEGQNGA